MQAVVGWPPGYLYFARWPADAVAEGTNVESLVGTWVVIVLAENRGLNTPETLAPLRLAKVKKVRVVWGAASITGMAPAYQLKLVLGPWPTTRFDPASVPNLATAAAVRAGSNVLSDGPAELADTVRTKLTTDVALRIRSWIIADDLGRHQVDFSPESWSAIAGAVLSTRAHRGTPLMTMTSLRPNGWEDLNYSEPPWYHELEAAVREQARAIRRRFPTQSSGHYVIRSGTPHTARMMLCLPGFAQAHDLGPRTAVGISATDQAITALRPPQILHPAVFDLIDLPFVASAARTRRTVLTIGPTEGELRVDLSAVDLQLKVVPPIHIRLVQVGSVLAAITSVALLAYGKDAKVWAAVLTAAAAAFLGTLIKSDR